MTSRDLINKKYRLTKSIGEGAMGIVWAAVNELTSREVALKVIRHSTPDLRVRLLREANACGRLPHRNIIEVFDVGVTEAGDPFLVMPLLTGETLAQRLERTRRIEPVTAATIARDVARALEAAHAASIIHRDLKPANIFLHQEAGSSGAVVKVLDFGVSKDLASAEALTTVAGGPVGSPAYMSPEQVRASRDLDHRTDLWSLGAVLFEMLTGTRAFQGDAARALQSILAGEIPRVSSILWRADPKLDAIVARCLERNPDRRMPSASELIRALEDFLGSSEVSRVHTDLPVGSPSPSWEPAVPSPSSPRVSSSRADPFVAAEARVKVVETELRGDADDDDDDENVTTVPVDLKKLDGLLRAPIPQPAAPLPPSMPPSVVISPASACTQRAVPNGTAMLPQVDVRTTSTVPIDPSQVMDWRGGRSVASSRPAPPPPPPPPPPINRTQPLEKPAGAERPPVMNRMERTPTWMGVGPVEAEPPPSSAYPRSSSVSPVYVGSTDASPARSKSGDATPVYSGVVDEGPEYPGPGDASTTTGAATFEHAPHSPSLGPARITSPPPFGGLRGADEQKAGKRLMMLVGVGSAAFVAAILTLVMTLGGSSKGPAGEGEALLSPPSATAAPSTPPATSAIPVPAPPPAAPSPSSVAPSPPSAAPSSSSVMKPNPTVGVPGPQPSSSGVSNVPGRPKSRPAFDWDALLEVDPKPASPKSTATGAAPKPAPPKPCGKLICPKPK